jgi:molecular chaperone DnaK (HSP70)
MFRPKIKEPILGKFFWLSFLSVVAQRKLTKKVSQHISIKSETGRLSPERIEELVAEAARHQEEDQRRMEQIEAKNGFERFLFQLKQTMTR